MKERTEGDRKIIFIPPTLLKEQLPPWEIDLVPNLTLLDPYKNLIPEKVDKTENIPHQKGDQLANVINFKSFFSNDSQLGDMPAEIPSFSSFHDDHDNPELAAFSTISLGIKHTLPTQQAREEGVVKSGKGKKKLQNGEQRIQLEQSNYRRMKNSKKIMGSIQAGESPIAISCKCKKSKCLKMYCQCFVRGNICGQSCQCVGCDNIPSSPSPKKRFRGRKKLEQKTEATVKNVQIQKQPDEHSGGCSCRKTQCMKKYCECYNSGKVCNFNCKCEGCLNQEEY